MKKAGSENQVPANQAYLRRKKIKILRVLAIFFTVFWMALIFYSSAKPRAQSHETSYKVTQKLRKLDRRLSDPKSPVGLTQKQWEAVETILRKLAHVAIFCMLSLSLMLALFTFPLGMVPRVLINLIFSVAYACSDELHQLLVAAGRGASVLDVIFDSMGAVIGIVSALLLYCVVYTVTHKKQQGKPRDLQECAGGQQCLAEKK